MALMYTECPLYLHPITEVSSTEEFTRRWQELQWQWEQQLLDALQGTSLEQAFEDALAGREVK